MFVKKKYYADWYYYEIPSEHLELFEKFVLWIGIGAIDYKNMIKRELITTHARLILSDATAVTGPMFKTNVNLGSNNPLIICDNNDIENILLILKCRVCLHNYWLNNINGILYPFNCDHRKQGE